MKVLAYDDLAIGVAADTSGHLAWLEEFLCPPFRAVPDAPAAVTITLTVDKRRHQAWARDWRPAGDVDCFALDSTVLHLPVRREPDGTLVVWDEQFVLFYRIDPQTRHVEVLAHRDRPALRTPLMRLVREVAMNHARRRGQLFLHAASVAVGGRAAVVCGVKNAGKTTLLLHLMSALGTDYVGNDRAVVGLDGDTPRLRGMPSIVTVRPPTLALLPEFRARLMASGYHSRATLAELAGGEPCPPATFSDGRYGLTPVQMAELVGAERVNEATAHSLAFPSVTRRPGPIRVRPLDRNVAATRLATSAWDGSNLNRIASALDFATAPSAGPPAWQALCERLVDQVRCYEVELGNEAYADVAVSRAELGKLFA
jgi:hypothetical protein